MINLSGSFTRHSRSQTITPHKVGGLSVEAVSERVRGLSPDALAARPIEAFVRRRCEAMGCSLQSLVKEAQISRSLLYKLFDGSASDPSVGVLIRLAAALRVPVVALTRFYATDCCPKSYSRHTHARGLANPQDEISFVGDITIPDHSVVLPREAFRKVWAIRNAGRATWRGRRFVRVDEDLVVARRVNGSLELMLDAHLTSFGNSIPLPDLEPDEVYEPSMDFRSPSESCSVASVWRMVDACGTPCFPPHFFLQVVVTVIAE